MFWVGFYSKKTSLSFFIHSGLYPALPQDGSSGAGMQPNAPPPQYQPPGQPVMQQPATTVIIQQAPSFGPDPVQMVCPHCQAQTQTKTDSKPGTMAWVICCVLCVCG